MKFYKVFRVEDEELYSAFEGWRDYCRRYSEKKIHYKVGEISSDPKPPGEHCPGLMILLDKRRAVSFLMCCGPSNLIFALHEVKPRASVTIPLDELTYSYSYICAHTDSLEVGKLVKRNR